MLIQAQMSTVEHWVYELVAEEDEEEEEKEELEEELRKKKSRN
jgi:riboflavin synthase